MQSASGMRNARVMARRKPVGLAVAGANAAKGGIAFIVSNVIIALKDGSSFDVVIYLSDHLWFREIQENR